MDELLEKAKMFSARANGDATSLQRMRYGLAFALLRGEITPRQAAHALNNNPNNAAAAGNAFHKLFPVLQAAFRDGKLKIDE